MSALARRVAQVIFGNEGLARRLERSRVVQALAEKLNARAWINAALKRYPIRRERSGVQYRVETFEALAVEKTYFGNPAYTEIFSQQPPETFIDLGCNCGIFVCFLAHLAPGRNLRGLGIDASQSQIELAQKNAQLNHWPDIHFRHGLVGSRSTGPETEFFLHPTSLGSSQFAYTDSESGHATRWQKIIVPTLHVTDLWTQLVGPNQRCQCLKIDIEGSEMLFLQQETVLLKLVDSILLEWHSWGTSKADLIEFLAAQGFPLTRTIEDFPRHGVLFFRRA